MDYGQACRQTFIYRITEGLPVIRPESMPSVRYQTSFGWSNSWFPAQFSA